MSWKSFLIKNKKNIIKKIILSSLKITRRNINNIKTLYIKGPARFGNYFISINNAILYCEFLGCKKIIMEYNKNIYINDRTSYKKGNFTIEPNQTFNSLDNNSLILDIYFFLFNGFRYFRNINRINIFKKQLLNNLPKVVTYPNELYIYIRGGDIFKNPDKSAHNYFQPPLCFYKIILDKFKFEKVFIITEDKLNPIIPKLLSKYYYIKINKNIIKVDISYLIHSYNLVAARSTFFLTSIKFNTKLKFLWEYDFEFLYQKYLHLHYSVYNFPCYFKIYKMESSNNYRRIMYPWINSPNQRKMMIKEKCLNNFNIINSKHIFFP
jgi:hypothetical protein